jgi:glycosyltransferase involved in cell wall biosynthesis
MLFGPAGPRRPEDWLKAAGTVADVVGIASVPELSLPPVPGLPYVGRDPELPHRYEVVTGVGRHLTARRVMALLRMEAAECGRLHVLHAHAPCSDVPVPWLAGAARIPYVLSTGGPPLTGRLARRRAGRLHESAAAVLALPHPVDAEALPRVPARARIRQDPVRVAVTGGTENWDALVHAFAEAHAKDVRLQLHVIGELPGPRGRAALLHDLAHADLFATARAWDLTALDALCCGTPVVGADAPALVQAAAALPYHRPDALAAEARRRFGTAAVGARLAAAYAEACAGAYADASASASAPGRA